EEDRVFLLLCHRTVAEESARDDLQHCRRLINRLYDSSPCTARLERLANVTGGQALIDPDLVEFSRHPRSRSCLSSRAMAEALDGGDALARAPLSGRHELSERPRLENRGRPKANLEFTDVLAHIPVDFFQFGNGRLVAASHERIRQCLEHSTRRAAMDVLIRA